jgi:hypothetical protein
MRRGWVEPLLALESASQADLAESRGRIYAKLTQRGLWRGEPDGPQFSLQEELGQNRS